LLLVVVAQVLNIIVQVLETEQIQVVMDMQVKTAKAE
jgi:hypothetical protein